MSARKRERGNKLIDVQDESDNVLSEMSKKRPREMSDLDCETPSPKAVCTHEIDESEFEWNDEQRLAIDEIINKERNVFITGPAGSGKSALLRHLIQLLQKKHGFHRVSVCATTGIAALPINGTTLHSFAGAGLAMDTAESLIEQISKKNPRAKMRWQTTKVLVVDEVSMLHREFFEKLDAIARGLRGKQSHLPFGGIQLVLTGDFLQLPPVNKTQHTSKYIFQSKIWRTAIHTMIGLKHIYRQNDNVFMNMLNRMRYGALTLSDVDLLNTRVVGNQKTLDRSKSTFLYSKREPAHAHNCRELGKIDSPAMEFEASDWCNGHPDGQTALANLQKHCPAEATITLKEGALVVLLKNILQESGLVNGARGIITHLHQSLSLSIHEDDDSDTEKRDALGFLFATPGSQAVTVKFDNGVLATIGSSVWSVETRGPQGNPRLLCTRSQIPFCLSWAISIHKSQGMTLQSACVSLTNLFESGQGYVACGRLTSLEGLYILQNFDPAGLKADPEVVDFYTRHNL